jgi:hypothetical protein
MARCAIMQPTFLPWAGYFRLIAQADAFVFLDDVQLARQSWQTRNRVLIGGQVHWIAAPIKHISLEQRVKDTQIAQGARWRTKTARLLRQSYAKHPYASELEHLVAALEAHTEERLADLNIALIETCCERLHIDTPRRRASDMWLETTQRTDRLIEICESLACDTYLSPPGASEYLSKDGFKARTRIKLQFANDHPPAYEQIGLGTFVSHLSVVDLIANLGWRGAGKYIRAEWKDED